MKTETERGYLMTNDEKIKTNKELAQEIVKAWNNKLDDETQEEFEDRLKEKEEKEFYRSYLLCQKITIVLCNFI